MLIGHEAYDGVGGLSVEFGTVRFIIAQQVAGILDAHDLHAQAKTEIGYFVLARPARRDDFALNAPVSKSARHDDSL